MEEEKRYLTLNDLNEITKGRVFNDINGTVRTDPYTISKSLPNWLLRLSNDDLMKYLATENSIVPIEIMGDEFIAKGFDYEYLRDAYVKHLQSTTLPSDFESYNKFDYHFKERAFELIKGIFANPGDRSFYNPKILSFMKACDWSNEDEFLNLEDYTDFFYEYTDCYYGNSRYIYFEIIEILSKRNFKFLEARDDIDEYDANAISYVDFYNFLRLLDKCEEYPFLQDILLDELCHGSSLFVRDLLARFFAKFYDAEKIANCGIYFDYDYQFIRTIMSKLVGVKIKWFFMSGENRFIFNSNEAHPFYNLLRDKLIKDPLHLSVKFYNRYFDTKTPNNLKYTEIIFVLASYSIDRERSPVTTHKLLKFFNGINCREIKEIIWDIIHMQMDNPKLEIAMLTKIWFESEELDEVDLNKLVLALIDRYYRNYKPSILVAMCLKLADVDSSIKLAASMLYEWNAYEDSSVAALFNFDLEDVNASFTRDDVLVYKKCQNDRIVIAKLYPDSIVRGNLPNLCDLSKENKTKYRKKDSEHSKYRTNHVKIVDIINGDNSETVHYNYAISKYDGATLYMPGDEIIVKDFDPNFEECSTGFHFFRHMDDAIDY